MHNIHFLCCVYFAPRLFCLVPQDNCWSYLPLGEHDWLKCHLTSLERMSYLVDHDICNSSVTRMDDGCHGFRVGKQLAASCLH